MPEYSDMEMIAYTGSRVLEDEKIVFVGTGLPIIAAMHAQLTHAPNLYMIYEAGSLAPVLDMGMPLSVGDTRAARKAMFLKGLCSAFELTQRGFSDYAFIGGAQIDMYGNICSTMEGANYDKPTIRFPGSGGAGAMAANCEKTIAIMALEKRRFVNKVDFLTSIGFGDGSPDYREKAGVMGSGPYRVITNQALFGFDEKTRRMMLLEVKPGLTPKDIQEKVSFELVIPPVVKEMVEPSDHDLSLLRDVIDKDGYFLKKKVQK
ncbi:CoA-transferase subunit beta [Desulforhabdus amnigena]|jgi:glutaconate CoA-transferase subunit B|uniref:3-oxoadipate--succinyl-CoA transferase subunit B n=1 Tax=Desulforhabdus amnigena TaxID=40218 RepID=A0A9W6D382_9BACT|nr:CoA-transferase [Desulforhabdus amnigena]NLJ28332.1 glutaconate CoA-transferase [Deltaproteobacteria bacterium]GLI33387.1 3-oxoadipate--succinyl-CoA transferase subunit B [Desulforhabdus amnigena]